MYTLTTYNLHSVTPLMEIRPRDWKCLNTAAAAAEKSLFEGSMRLGACIEGKGQCLLCR